MRLKPTVVRQYARVDIAGIVQRLSNEHLTAKVVSQGTCRVQPSAITDQAITDQARQIILGIPWGITELELLQYWVHIILYPTALFRDGKI